MVDIGGPWDVWGDVAIGVNRASGGTFGLDDQFIFQYFLVGKKSGGQSVIGVMSANDGRSCFAGYNGNAFARV